MTRRVLGTLAWVLLGLLALAPGAHAAFPGENGKIATTRYEFVGHGAGSPDVYTVNPDGSGATALTDDDTSSRPAWSADGEKIAFMRILLPPHPPGSCESPCTDIYVINANGTGLTKVTSGNSYDHSPAWSPDGSKIVFASYRSGNSDIYTMNADGSGVTQITTYPGSDLAPAWSPDGTEIAFSRYLGAPVDTYTLHVVRADGSGERELVSGQNPDWSPDGSRLTYEDQGQVWVVNADGTGVVKLTTEPTTTYPDGPYFLLFNKNPAWSPDGSKIVFEHGECGWGACSPPLLETVNPDGSGRAPIATWPDSSGGEPDWQPIPAANQPPDCSGVTARPGSLRHHGFQTVALRGATDPDGDAVTITITGVTQDEPVGRRPDARAGDSSDQVELRGRHRPRGDGRVYRIAFTASDGTDECSGVATVEVRRKKTQLAIDSAPPSYSSFGG